MSSTNALLIAVAVLLLATGGAGYYFFLASGADSDVARLDDPSDAPTFDSEPEDDPGPYVAPDRGDHQQDTEALPDGEPDEDSGLDPRDNQAPSAQSEAAAPPPNAERTPSAGGGTTRSSATSTDEEQAAQAAAERKAAEEAQRKKLEAWAEKAPFHRIRGAAARGYRSVRGNRNRRQSRGNGDTPKTKLEPVEEGMNPEADDQLQPGLYGQYYAMFEQEPLRVMAAQGDPTARAPTFSRVDYEVNFPDRESFGFPQPTTNFVVRWRGFIYMEEDTELELWLGNDVGGAVMIDGQTVILNDVFSWYVDTGTRVELSKGYHQLVVEHIENHQPEDPNMNSACRLMYMPEGETKAVPLPSEWLFQPLELSDYAPRVSGVSPRSAEVGDEVTIHGINLVPRMISVGEVSEVNGGDGNWSLKVTLSKDWQGKVGDAIELRDGTDQNLGSAIINSFGDGWFTATYGGEFEPREGTQAVIPYSSGQFFEGQTRVRVTIGGVDAEVLSSSAGALRARVPVGADSGKIEVNVGGMPSNQVDFTVSTSFGLVVAVWDLTGQAYDFVDPNSRSPDFVVLDENPFPLTPDKYPQFAGKPIAVRLEGFVASAAAGNHALREEGAQLESFEGTVPSNEGENKLVAIISKAHVRVSVSGAGYEFNALEDDQEREEMLPLNPSERPEWNQLVCEVVFDPSLNAGGAKLSMGTRAGLGLIEKSANSNVGGSAGGVERWTNTLELTQRRFYRPAFIPPEPPRIFVDQELHGDAPAAPVGGELRVWVNVAEAGSQSEHELSFSVDGVGAPYQRDPDADVSVHTEQSDAGQESSAFLRYIVTIPDGAGEGMVRARRGIVQSESIQINVSNRGLVGYYYDFDQVLRDIPAMDALSPVMKRLDKGLRFENNTDFDLPMPAERFSAEWYGSIRIPEGMSGEWTFYIQSDDGFRLTIGDSVVSEFPGLRPPRESSGQITLSEGWHDLHMTFYENDVLENCVVWWVPPGSPEGFREFIPLKHLSTERQRGVPDKQVIPPAAANKD